MTVRGHIPSFRALGLPPGYADCTVCGHRITKPEMVWEPCPGPPVATKTDEQRPA